MEFKTASQEISPALKKFAHKKIKESKMPASRATKNDLNQIAAISREIEEKGLPDDFVLRKLKGKLGHGIFLHPEAKPILKGEIIAPYAGEVFLCPKNDGSDSDYVFCIVSDLLLSKREQALLDPKNRYHPRRLYSIDLDAHKKGNFTRFINHSAQPNVEASLLRIPSKKGPASFEIIYIAKKKIRPGEQLLVCYEGDDKSYWGAMKIKPFPMTPRTFVLDASLKVCKS
jgi:hypothetical protein